MCPIGSDISGVFEAIPAPACLVDAAGTIAGVNQAFLEYRRLLGFPARREGLVGQPLSALAMAAGPDDPIVLVAAEALEAGHPLRRRAQLTDAESRPVHVDLRARPWRDAADGLAGALILCDNITEAVRHTHLAEVVARLRRGVEAMGSSGDVEDLLAAVRDGLTDLGILFANCGVNVVDGAADPPTVRYHTMGRDGYSLAQSQIDSGRQVVVDAWNSGEVAYRPDLASDDPNGEGSVLSNAFEEPVLSVVDVPFSHGTLAVNSLQPWAFSTTDIDTFKAMAGVLSEGFTRLEDFRRLEERNRELVEQVRQRHEAEAALRDGEQRYRSLVENLPVGVSHTLPDGHVVYQNPAALAIHGHSWDELAGMTAADLYCDPADRDDLVRNLEIKGNHTFEARLRHRDGHAVWTRNTSTVVRDQRGDVLYFLGLSEDITESRRRQVRQQAVQQLRDEVWRMEREADIERVIATVRSGLELMGVPVDGCSIHVVDTATDPPTVNSYRSRTGDTAWQAGINRVAADGVLQNWRGGEVAYRPDLDREDRLDEAASIDATYGIHVRSVVDVPFSQGTLGVNNREPNAFGERDLDAIAALADVLSEGFRRLEDLRALERRLGDLEREISERRHLEGQLRQAQKMEAVGQLTAGLAHNFNNMLQGIVGNVSLALMQTDGDLHDILTDANQSAERAAEMIHHLMTFSRQGLQPELRPIDMAALTTEAVEMARRTFDRRIAITADIATGSAGEILGDAGQLQQVVLNLLINARDALDETTADPAIRVELETVTVPGADATPPDARPGPYVVARVIDNGVGMDDETLERVFEPFFTTKDVDKGTGLGLSTVYGIVQQHGGWISCQSAACEGTTFAVFLPETSTPADEGAGPDSESEPRGAETILVIDDEDIVRRTVSRLLGHYGYTVVTAEDGASGVELFSSRADDVDLILLDLSMPGMSGREALPRLRAVSAQTPIALFTGYAAEQGGDLDEIDTVIQKPFTSLHLARTVRALLDAATPRSDR